jgi:hypothetical protein
MNGYRSQWVLSTEKKDERRKQLNGILSGVDKFRLSGWDLHSYRIIISDTTALCPAGRE